MNKIIEKKNKHVKKNKVQHSKKTMFIPTVYDLLAICFLMNENQKVSVRRS